MIKNIDSKEKGFVYEGPWFVLVLVIFFSSQEGLSEGQTLQGRAHYEFFTGIVRYKVYTITRVAGE